jgi:hypothetical protein
MRQCTLIYSFILSIENGSSAWQSAYCTITALHTLYIQVIVLWSLGNYLLRISYGYNYAILEIAFADHC